MLSDPPINDSIGNAIVVSEDRLEMEMEPVTLVRAGNERDSCSPTVAFDRTTSPTTVVHGCRSEKVRIVLPGHTTDVVLAPETPVGDEEDDDELPYRQITNKKR